MQEPTAREPVQESPQLNLMRAKLPDMKKKLEQPFCLNNRFNPIDETAFENRLAELKSKFGEECKCEDLIPYLDVILGHLEGLNGMFVPSALLAEHLGFNNRDIWNQVIKDKTAVKYYGQPKDKQQSVLQIKDLEVLKTYYDIEAIKKHRKIRKQYGTFYKTLKKFIQKFQKLQTQSQVAQLYQEYKKVQTQESKFKKLIETKDKIPNLKNDENLKEPAPELLEQKIEEPKKTKKKGKKQDKKDKEEKQKGEQKIDEKSEEQKINQDDMKSLSKQKDEKENKDKKKKKPQPASAKKPSKEDLVKAKNTSLFNFFSKKEENKPKVKPQSEPEELPKEKQDQQETKLSKFLSFFNQNLESRPTIQSLKSQFADNRMKNQHAQMKTCYANIVLLQSRLEYENFPITQLKVPFAQPRDEIEDIRYENSSEEYSQLIADSINEEMIQEEDEDQEQNESNSAIVPDSICEYHSSYDISSQSESSEEEVEKKVKPQSNKMGKWFFNYKTKPEHNIQIKYTAICLFQEIMPLPVRDVADEAPNDITPIQKIQMYKEIHGSYTPKDLLIKKVNTIVDNKITMNKLSQMIKDMCEKKGNQRTIKMQIIRQIAEEMTDINPNLQDELEKLRDEREKARNQQIEAKREEKNNEKQEKLEKLILAYDGVWNVNEIREYLKKNDLKMIKNDLSAFIKSKEGEQWQKIRSQIKKNRLKRGRHPKNKLTQEQQQKKLKNTHKPIQQILKQNELDMANRPKKIRKQPEEDQIIQQSSANKKTKKQKIIQEQQAEADDDQSYDAKGQNKKISKKRKRVKKQKKVFVNVDPMVPTRRNPRRNKIKKNEKKQEQGEEQNNSNNEIVEEMECQQNNQIDVQIEEQQIMGQKDSKMDQQKAQVSENKEENLQQAEGNNISQIQNNENENPNLCNPQEEVKITENKSQSKESESSPKKQGCEDRKEESELSTAKKLGVVE